MIKGSIYGYFGSCDFKEKHTLYKTAHTVKPLFFGYIFLGNINTIQSLYIMSFLPM